MTKAEKLTLSVIGIGVLIGALIVVFFTVIYVPPPATDLAKIERTGGLTVDGLFSEKYTLMSNGTVIYPDGSKDERKIPDYLLEQIKEELENPNALSTLKVNPNAVCPSSYDGQDSIYTFVTISEKEYKTCEYFNYEQVRLFQLLDQV